MVGRYEPEVGKVVWYEDEVPRKEPLGEAPAIWGPLEYHGIGFRGAPMVTSRNQHKALLREHGCVEVGNEAPPAVQRVHEQRRTHGR